MGDKTWAAYRRGFAARGACARRSLRESILIRCASNGFARYAAGTAAAAPTSRRGYARFGMAKKNLDSLAVAHYERRE